MEVVISVDLEDDAMVPLRWCDGSLTVIAKKFGKSN
jgi:hypothetical protein